MNLLAATTRYYLLLVSVLFVAGSIGLYQGMNWAPAQRAERAAGRFGSRNWRARPAPTSCRPWPSSKPCSTSATSPGPRGFRDTLLLDPIEHDLVPHRLLTFPLRVRGRGPGVGHVAKIAGRGRRPAGRGAQHRCWACWPCCCGGMVLLNWWLIAAGYGRPSGTRWQPCATTTCSSTARWSCPPPHHRVCRTQPGPGHGFSQRLVADYETPARVHGQRRPRNPDAPGHHAGPAGAAAPVAGPGRRPRRRPARGRPLRGHAAPLAPAPGPEPAQQNRKPAVCPGPARAPRPAAGRKNGAARAADSRRGSCATASTEQSAASCCTCTPAWPIRCSRTCCKMP